MIISKDRHKLTLKLICPTCKKILYSRPGRLGKGKTSIHCSIICYSKRGSLNPNWNGGRRKHDDGYIWIYSPNHPRKTKAGYVLEHRLIVEKKIGRYLNSKEVIHHINHIKNDNRIENLQLCQDSSEHGHIHKPRILKVCVWCGKEFFRKENPYLRKNNWSKTCSRSCGAHLRWSNFHQNI